MRDRSNTGSESVEALPRAPVDEALTRRTWLGTLLNTATAVTLSGCAAEALKGQVDAEDETPDIGSVTAALSGTNFKWVDTILGAVPSAARTGVLATTTSATLSASAVIAEGCVTAGDGGGGVFFWSTTAEADDGGTFIVPNASVGTVGQGWKRVFEGALNARWFGAQGRVGAGLDDTDAVQAALNAGVALLESVLLPRGTYPVKSLRVRNGLRSLRGSGTLVALGNYGEAVIELDGTYFSTAAVVECVFSGLTVDCTAGSRRGVFAATAVRCTFDNLFIRGLTVDNLSDTGIYLHFDSIQNTVQNNRITLLENPTSTMIGIAIAGQALQAYNGYYVNGGTFDQPTRPCYENRIFGNHIFGGSHGISISNSFRTTITSNQLMRQRDRGIILSPFACYNMISGNVCQDFKSSGVHLAYGCSHNIISHNLCVSFISAGEAGIQAYVGCTNNEISHNTVECTSNYGVYLAIGAQANSVHGNRLSGYRRAAIALESDWKTPAPSPYSRPNYGPPPSGTHWAFVESSYNVVSNNIIGDPSQMPSAALVVAQVGTLGLSATIIRDNEVQTSGVSHVLYFFEETANVLSNCVVVGTNSYGAPPAKFVLPRGRAHLRRTGENETLNGGPFAFATNDTTPSVAIGDQFFCLNTLATLITNFDDGMDTQEFTLRLDVFTQIKHDTAVIRLKGGTNVVGVNADNFIRFRRVSGIWFEISRNW